MMTPLVIKVTQTPGRCRWCGCTYYDPCPEGCGWANADQTVCTSCQRFDKLLRSVGGRRIAVELFKIGDDVHDAI